MHCDITSISLSSGSSAGGIHTPRKQTGLAGAILTVAALGGLGTFPAFGQAARSATASAAQTRQAVTATPPSRIVEREGPGCGVSGTDYSIVWTFDGLKGTGKFDISRQQMDIDSFDGKTLVVRRTSYAGGQPGSGAINGTAVYTGLITGTHITGTAQYHPVGGPQTEGPWCGEIEDPRVLMPETLATKQTLKSAPPQIMECELDQYCDGLWSLDGTSGKAIWPRNPPVTANLTIESLNPDKIVIRRVDTSDSSSVVYTGKLTGNRISGMALAQIGNKSVPYNWTAVIPATSCARTDGLKLDSQEAVSVGNVAFRFHLMPSALDCYLIAAKNGNTRAQDMLVWLYYQGGDSSIKQDYDQAFYWAQKSAAQSDYMGETALGKLYQEGQGTVANPEIAQSWFDKAAATPEGRAIAAKKEIAQAQAAQSQALAGLFLGLLSGALDSDGGGDSPSNNRACVQSANHPERHYCSDGTTTY